MLVPGSKFDRGTMRFDLVIDHVMGDLEAPIVVRKVGDGIAFEG